MGHRALKLVLGINPHESILLGIKCPQIIQIPYFFTARWFQSPPSTSRKRRLPHWHRTPRLRSHSSAQRWQQQWKSCPTWRNLGIAQVVNGSSAHIESGSSAHIANESSAHRETGSCAHMSGHPRTLMLGTSHLGFDWGVEGDKSVIDAGNKGGIHGLKSSLDSAI